MFVNYIFFINIRYELFNVMFYLLFFFKNKCFLDIDGEKNVFKGLFSMYYVKFKYLNFLFLKWFMIYVININIG